MLDTQKRPQWMTSEAYRVLKANYLMEGEEPFDMYQRVATASAEALGKPALAERFFELMWRGWLCPATPVLTNMGTERGLPISCYSVHVQDSTHSILSKALEQGMMSKGGGGVGIYLGDIRPRGLPIRSGGTTDGVTSWCRIFEAVMSSISQGGVRRGAAAVYLPVEHGDLKEFLSMRRAHIESSDTGSKAYSLHHALNISDKFMQGVLDKDPECVGQFFEILKTRIETGEPYIHFVDNVNKAKGECYERLGLDIVTSNICTEVELYTDELHSFVCCLSSLNALRWDEWGTKDSRVVEDSIWFLDGVMQEFINKVEKGLVLDDHRVMGLENALRFAVKSRALGLGVLGLHSLYQSKMLPAGSFASKNLNKAIFKYINEHTNAATLELGKEYGEPEWCIGTGRRNTHLMACAPTVSNSIISGGVSPGVEPFAYNIYSKKTAQGFVTSQSQGFIDLLESKGLNTKEFRTQVIENGGSIQNLPQFSDEEKAVFRTAREIPQHLLVDEACDRAPWIDQGQSINLFFTKGADPTYIAKVHVQAWRGGLKALYYCKSESVLKADTVSVQSTVAKVEGLSEPSNKYEVCEACSG